MRSLCPTCRRSFDEPGFCPFDGTPLGPDPEADQEPPTQHEPRRETLPLTPSPEPPNAASPVYALVTLPPGADAGIVPSLPARPLQSSEAALPISQAATEPGTPRARPSPTTRQINDEPERTAGEAPPSLQHMATDEPVPARGRRRPWWLVVALIAGGVAGAVGFVVVSRHGGAADRTRDASLVALPVDAGMRQALQAPLDAVPDATELIALPEPDAGPPVRPETPNHRGTVRVKVVTRPEGANLYDGSHDRGASGTEIEGELGTKLVLACRQPGYKPGTVEIHFNGTTTIATCVMQRIRICIDGIKNPFDDCEIDPAGPSGPAAESLGNAGSAAGAPIDDPEALIDPNRPNPPNRPNALPSKSP